MITNGFYHIVTSAGLAVQLPKDAKPETVTVEPNLTLNKTPYGTTFWLEGDGQDQPFTLGLSFLVSGASEDAARAQIRDLYLAAQSAVKLVRDFNMELPVHPFCKRSFTPTNKSSVWQVAFTFYPKQSQWLNTANGLLYPF